MKKVLVLLAFAGCALGASAQGLYVKAHGSFQIGAAEGNMLAAPQDFLSDEGFYPLLEGDLNGSVKYAQGSYGEGVYAGIGVGYMFNEYVGIELGIGNLFGSDQDYVITSGADAFTTTNSFKVLGITPSIVLNAPLGDKLSLSSRFGAFVGVSPELEQTWGYSGFSQAEILTENATEGTVGIGFQTALGLEYALSDVLALSFDLTYTGLNFEPENGSITKFTVDGVDQLDDLNSDFRNYTYGEFEGPTNQLPSFKVSASSLGFGLGLKYRFGK
jgi:hypothetical protein